MVDISRGGFFSRKKKSSTKKKPIKKDTSVSNIEQLAFLARHSILSVLSGVKDFDEYLGKEFIDKQPFQLIEKTWGNQSSGICISLYVHDEFRGSWLDRSAEGNIYDTILDFSKKAAFEDNRFPPLNKKEFKSMTIEIMLVDKESYPIEYKDPIELTMILERNKDKGVLVTKQNKTSYFLPDTWEHIPNPAMFLSSLCKNAGLQPSAWRGEKRLWPQKLTDKRRDLYTGKIIEPEEYSGVDIEFLQVKGYQGDGKHFTK